MSELQSQLVLPGALAANIELSAYLEDGMGEVERGFPLSRTSGLANLLGLRSKPSVFR